MWKYLAGEAIAFLVFCDAFSIVAPWIGAVPRDVAVREHANAQSALREPRDELRWIVRSAAATSHINNHPS